MLTLKKHPTAREHKQEASWRQTNCSSWWTTSDGDGKASLQESRVITTLFFFLLPFCKTIQKWTNWQSFLACLWSVCCSHGFPPCLKPHLQVLPFASDQPSSPLPGDILGTTAAKACQRSMLQTNTIKSNGEQGTQVWVWKRRCLECCENWTFCVPNFLNLERTLEKYFSFHPYSKEKSSPHTPVQNKRASLTSITDPEILLPLIFKYILKGQHHYL